MQSSNLYSICCRHHAAHHAVLRIIGDSVEVLGLLVPPCRPETSTAEAHFLIRAMALRTRAVLRTQLRSRRLRNILRDDRAENSRHRVCIGWCIWLLTTTQIGEEQVLLDEEV